MNFYEAELYKIEYCGKKLLHQSADFSPTIEYGLGTLFDVKQMQTMSLLTTFLIKPAKSTPTKESRRSEYTSSIDILHARPLDPCRCRTGKRRRSLKV
jgi:hypothetical protein